MNQYIRKPVFDWLSGKDNPLVRNLVLKEFFDDEDSATRMESVSFFKDKFPYCKAADLNRKSLYMTFAASAGMSVLEDFFSECAEDVVASSFTECGGFSPAWKPRTACAGWSGSILKALLKAGYCGSEVHRCAEWLVSVQRNDGGWLYSPVLSSSDILKMYLFRKPGKGLVREAAQIPSSVIASACVVEALMVYCNIYGKYSVAVQLGLNFLGGEIVKRKYEKRGIYYNSDFLKIANPLLCQTDILHVAAILAKSGRLDRETVPLFNKIVLKQNNFGSYNLESAVHGTESFLNGGRSGVPDKWCTLNACRLFSAVSF